MTTTTPNHYLKREVIAEPLVLGWFANPFLIAPQTAACWLANRYVPILESYLKDPGLHEEASRSDALRGGPFINFPNRCTAQAQALLDRMRREGHTLLSLAASIKTASDLVEKLSGGSLEPVYTQMPAPLKGLVELLYDINNRSTLRFIEPLCYARYDTSPLHELLLQTRPAEQRPFVGSTPRLPEPREVLLKMPFRDRRLDALFESSRHGASVPALAEALGIDRERCDDFATMFSPTLPVPPLPIPGDPAAVSVSYFGHACVLLRTQTASILVDPFIATGHEHGVPKYVFDHLPDRIDFVLLTHTHADHVSIESLLRLRHRIGTIVVPQNSGGTLIDPSLKVMLRSLGFEDVVEMRELEELRFDQGRIVSVPFLGEHGDLYILSKTSYRVSLNGKTFLFAADSNNLTNELYAQVRQQLGPTDVLFVGMECVGAPVSWVYAPFRTRPFERMHDQGRRLNGSNADKAIEMVRSIGASSAYVYAMGSEPWQRHIMSGVDAEKPTSPLRTEPAKFVQACQAHGIPSRMLRGCETWSA